MGFGLRGGSAGAAVRVVGYGIGFELPLCVQRDALILRILAAGSVCRTGTVGFRVPAGEVIAVSRRLR